MTDEKSSNAAAGDDSEAPVKSDFIRAIVAEDLAADKHGGKIATRFPPEPNGYLHIGHAKSICLNFGIAGENANATCNLRFDDTNPAAEEVEYVDSIKEDVRWLGFDWGDREFYASNYFDRLYDFAVGLIKAGKAYVCELSMDEFGKEYRGAPTSPGRESPFRNRSSEENLDLFERMKAGEFDDGARVLRAKIDMASPNLHLRDPVIYRIKKVPHHRTGDAWKIYPMYDYTHCLSDAIEGITHSLCTLEFEVHRPLYDWVIDEVDIDCHPRQIEFARLSISYTVLSKRRLLELVQAGLVSGWDDPRMPTISGFRRRGYTAESIRVFCERLGITKFNSLTDIALLEHAIREQLNKIALRVSGVLRPLKVVIENYPEDQSEELEAVNNPEDESAGTRMVPFSRELYIEQSDFMEDPPRKFFRLGPGREVRLRYAYFLTCNEAVKDPVTGEVVELRCTYDPETRGGNAPDGRKVKGTLHWVSAKHAIDAEVRLYDRLFTIENPNDPPEGKDYKEFLNPNSVEVLTGCKLEPSLGEAKSGVPYQFERTGYFCADSKEFTGEKPVFNRTVTLRDSWAKSQKK
ncbi:MAG: glutaminyl-tRNA synthetase [Limisphaerales bacterium]|jgi:glutaminyl-tRNA synthetase